MGYEYSIKNLEEEVLAIIILTSGGYLEYLKKLQKFIKDLINTKEYEKFINCTLLSIFEFMQKTKHNIEKENILIEIVNRISELKVENNRYYSNEISEYESIKKIITESKYKNFNISFQEKIIKYVDPYLIK